MFREGKGADANSKIPLAGATSSAPVTGSLYLDVTKSATDTSTVFILNTMLSTSILSSNPINLYGITSSGAAGDRQTVRGYTIPDTALNAASGGTYPSSSYSAASWYTASTQYAGIAPSGSDFTTRDYVTTYVQTIVSGGTAYAALGAAPSTAGSIPSLTQTFYANNNINGNTTFTGPNTTVGSTTTVTAFTVAPLDPTSTSYVNCITPSLTFSSPNANFKLSYDSANFSIATFASDTSANAQYALVPRGYIDTYLSSKIDNLLGPIIAGTWIFTQVLPTVTVSQLGITWNFPYAIGVPDIDGAPGNTFSTYFSSNSGDNGLKFLGIPDPTGGSSPVGAVFNITISGSWVTKMGNLSGNCVQASTAIIVGSQVVARNVQQDDDGGGKNKGFLTGTSCSATVFISPGDTVYLLVSNAEYACASIVRVR